LRRKGKKTSMVQFQVNYQTRELYMIDIVLKYRKYFLIILLLHILQVIRHCEVVVWNFMRLMRNKEFGS